LISNAAIKVVRKRRTLFWLAYLAAWLAFGLWLALNVIIGARNSSRPLAAWEPVTWELSSVVWMAGLAVLVYYFERRVPLSGIGWPRRLLLHIPVAIGFSAVHTLGMIGIRKMIYALHGSFYDFGDPLLGFAYELQKDLISYAAIAAACVTIRAIRLRRQRELTVLKLERDLSEARLAQLTAQIEPHFLFNTLNAISNRMHEDVDAADRMIAAFAELLRAALNESGSAFVRVADDMAWLERYFELMRERFRGKLETMVQLDAVARAAQIPRLLLQPLVENAFVHGLPSGRGRIDVSVSALNDRLHCRVEDNGVGLEVDFRSRVGLTNVRHRLELLYPQQHSFRIAAREGGGTRVDIVLPLVAVE
jgi:two-component system, LytTR family, sensor kinase